jgi:ferredoxin
MVTVNPSRCPQNHPCPSLRVCPTNAITQQGYGAPQIDMDKCIDCGRCAMSCRVFQWDGPSRGARAK